MPSSPSPAHRCAALLALAMLLVCPTGHAQRQAVRIGYLPQLQDVALLSLQERLRDSPTRVEFVRFQRYADAEAALMRGEIQLSSLGYDTLAAAAVRAGAPRYAYVAGLARGGVSLACRPGIKVDGWQGLKGRRIAVAGGLPTLFLDDALAQHELTADDVQRVKPAPNEPPMRQLEQGAADCAAVTEPAAATAVAAGQAYYPITDIVDNAFAGIYNGLAVNTAFLKAQRPLVQEVVRELNAATARYQQDADAWLQRAVEAKVVNAVPAATALDRVMLDTKLYVDESWALVASTVGAGNPPAGRGAVDAYFDTTLVD